MNILVTINSNYIKQLNILLNSIQRSNKNEIFDIYILNSDLTKKEIKEIGKGLNLDKIHLKDIKINEKDIEKLPVYAKRYPVEIYFRIFASKYLPKNLDRILYLDSDTLVINKLNELYNMDFEENYFIATTHIKKILHKFNEIRLGMDKDEPYINTGVLLMNLNELRNIKIEKEVINFIQKNERKLMLPDQDIISSIYGNKIKLIDDLKYNLGDRNLNNYNLNNPKNKIGIKWIRKNTVIIHYFGRNKPWNSGYVGKLGCFYNKFIEGLNNENKKVLVLSCGTGGGHNSAAKAIQEELISRNIKANFKEYLEIINPRLKDGVNKLYIKSTNKNGKVFKTAYSLGKMYDKTKLISPVYLFNRLNKEKLYRYIKNNKYSFVITTHLFAAQALTAIKKEHHIHFLQVATDYVSIPFWKETNPDYFVIPSKELESDFIEKGIKKQKLIPIGIPVMKKFNKNYNEKAVKKQLKLDIDKKYVLILNGSMGFGNVKEILQKLLESVTEDINFIISCGNNNELVSVLNNEYKNNKRVIVLPYTNEICKYMAISDIILSKPGGLTTTEIATMRKPLIHIMPIPGCENYNANFFSKRQMSLKCDNINQVVDNTKRLIENEELQQKLIENQIKYIAKNNCEKIVDIVENDLYRGNKRWKNIS